MQLKISHKGLMLVAIPLAFELLLVAVLVFLLTQTEAEVKRETRARRISSQNSLVARNMLDFMVGVGGYSVLQTSAFKDQYDRAVKTLPAEMDKLVAMLADQPDKQRVAKNIRDNFRKGVYMANDARIKIENGETAEALILLPKLKKMSFDASMQLNEIAKEERLVEKESPEKQAELRAQLMYWLVFSVFFNVGVSILLAAYFTRSITGRLQVMAENSSRLAIGQDLLPRVGGGDEIAVLDKTFHSMAIALSEANLRERALVEDAQDVICSIDASGRFLSVNAVAAKLWGYQMDELVGRRVIDIVEPSASMVRAFR